MYTNRSLFNRLPHSESLSMFKENMKPLTVCMLVGKFQCSNECMQKANEDRLWVLLNLINYKITTLLNHWMWETKWTKYSFIRNVIIRCSKGFWRMSKGCNVPLKKLMDKLKCETLQSDQLNFFFFFVGTSTTQNLHYSDILICNSYCYHFYFILYFFLLD